MMTELGKIAVSLNTPYEVETPLQLKIKEISKKLTLLIFIILIVIFIYGVYKGYEVIEIILLCVSLAVAAIPEGLSSIITIILSIGMNDMIKNKKNNLNGCFSYFVTAYAQKENFRRKFTFYCASVAHVIKKAPSEWVPFLMTCAYAESGFVPKPCPAQAKRGSRSETSSGTVVVSGTCSRREHMHALYKSGTHLPGAFFF